MPRSLARSILLAAVVAGCTTPPATTASPSPSPSAPLKVEVGEKTKEEIQAVLRAQHAALEKRDISAYQGTYDGTRNGLRRCKQEAFDVAGRAGTSPNVPQVLRVEPYGDIYARGWVDQGQGPDRGVIRMYFRMVGGKWVQSEPTRDEVGAEKTATIDGIDIEYWAIDDDVIEAMKQGTLAARDMVVSNQLAESRRPFGIRFYPTRTVGVPQACNVVGFHLVNQPEDKFIRLFAYWFTPDGKALSRETITFIQHEGLHWAQDQFIPGISARLDWWLVEGWPDYVGQSRSVSYKRSVVCGTGTPTYKQLADGPRDDLPEWKPEDSVRYYAFANTMIEYLYSQYGPNAYRDLLLAYKELADPSKNLPAVLKVTPDQFYSGWTAFARKKYC